MAIQLINLREFHGTLISKILRANGLLEIVAHVRETFSPDTPFLYLFLIDVDWL